MRKLLFVLAVTSFLGWFQPAEAFECPVGQKLRKIGNLQTGSANITTNSHDVRAISVASTGTASVAGLANVDTLGEVDAIADYVIEVGAPASEAKVYFFESPLVFSEGITFVDGGNVEAITLYECR